MLLTCWVSDISAEMGKMPRSRLVLFIILGVIGVTALTALLLFVLFANLIATPSSDLGQRGHSTVTSQLPAVFSTPKREERGGDGSHRRATLEGNRSGGVQEG